MAFLKKVKCFFQCSHYIELIGSERIITTAYCLVVYGFGDSGVAYFYFNSIVRSKRNWVAETSSCGFTDTTWAVVLDICVIALIAENAFHL